jgi:hypothetical protein
MQHYMSMCDCEFHTKKYHSVKQERPQGYSKKNQTNKINNGAKCSKHKEDEKEKRSRGVVEEERERR